jgi:hypothetical protein
MLSIPPILFKDEGDGGDGGIVGAGFTVGVGFTP